MIVVVGDLSDIPLIVNGILACDLSGCCLQFFYRAVEIQKVSCVDHISRSGQNRASQRPIRASRSRWKPVMYFGVTLVQLVRIVSISLKYLEVNYVIKSISLLS